MGGVCMKKKTQSYKFRLENLKGRDHLYNPDIDGEIILKC
jgi:hypothetical protein